MLLVLAQYACGAQVAKVTTAPATPDEFPQRGRSVLAPDPAPPVDTGSLRQAVSVVREFFTLYPAGSTRGDQVPRVHRLAELTTRFPEGLLDLHAFPGQHSVKTKPGTVASLAIRLMAPSTIQFVARVDQTKTASAEPAGLSYAVTVVRDGTWKVASLEPTHAGDSGEAAP
ncbi:hypothetical protein J4573_16565 [Actinomadura barringtoniae]|uniref:Uncharacterized protein n=1 Tax=Actinomadura barringtoniae TaxID=1427535 RepID=A0A939T6W7_9ACTN|nr:hypothetical protein [Actinomadura barringtoniae]MBO2448717.1 hypothetical protein [Actinomadura barringtoniae]